MEALAALSVASSVVQFVDFTSKILIDAHERCKGSSIADDEIRQSIASLDSMCSRLSASCTASGSFENDESIARLARQCITKGLEIIAILGSVTVKGKPWHALRRAVHTALKRPKMKQLQQEMENIKSQMSLHMLNVLRDGQTALMCKLEALCKIHERVHTEASAQLTSISKEMTEILQLDDLSIRARLMSLSSLQSTPEALPTRLKQLNAALHNNEKIQTILSQLEYSQIESRYNDITDAHNDTFQWIFERETGFSEWLKHGTGTYWITGKPGCGKSTLMKFIVDHERTMALLRHWAEGKSLSTASFYFWISGADVEKTQQGLLRSLLVQLLQAHPHLVERCFGDRWHSQSQRLFTHRELMAALRVVFTEELSTKFCLFIDGLDEYDTKLDKAEFYDLLQTLSQLRSTSVKMCVSSRPWIEFKDEFKTGLYVHEWTMGDIEVFVREQLGTSTRFQKLASHDRKATQLVGEITGKAEGVFLWVFLVVKSLLRGLGKHDNIEMLSRRLATYPPELNQFFDRILAEVEDVYLPYTACLMQMVATTEYVPIMAVEYVPIEHDDPGHALRMPVRSRVVGQLEEILASSRLQLDAWCRDLLVVRQCEYEYPRAHVRSEFFTKRIEFMHRTVKDYASSTKLCSNLAERARVDIDPWILVLRTYLYQAKYIDRNDATIADPGLSWFLATRHDLLKAVLLLEKSAHRTATSILEEVDRVGRFVRADALEDVDYDMEDPRVPDLHILARHGTLLRYAILYGLRLFVKARLAIDVTTPECATRLLQHLLLDEGIFVSRDPPWYAWLIRSLLAQGADVDAPQKGFIQSIWDSFVWQCQSGTRDSDLLHEVLVEIVNFDVDCSGLDIDVLMAYSSAHWSAGSEIDYTAIRLGDAFILAHDNGKLLLAPRHH